MNNIIFEQVKESLTPEVAFKAIKGLLDIRELPCKMPEELMDTLGDMCGCPSCMAGKTLAIIYLDNKKLGILTGHENSQTS